ncbi:MAG TPA: helix-turn-helix transcriptional regulator [Clostridia bacterium]|nr:helix-turn-helix transcriptional regulator [Clostridia bacterium]
MLRTLLTVLLALCLPFTMMGLTVIQRGYNQFSQSNNASYLENVRDFAAYFTEQTELMTTHALKIGLERKLTRTLLEAHPWNVVEAIQKLQSYQGGLDFVQAIGLHYSGTDYIVTSYNRADLYDFASRYSHGTAALTQRIVDFLGASHSNTGSYLSLYPDLAQEDAALLFAVPIFMNSSTHRDTLMVYVLTQDSLKNLRLGTYATGRYAQLIFSGDDQLLYASGSVCPFLQNTDFQAFLQDRTQSILEYADEIHYYIYKYHDVRQDRSYVSIVRREVVEENLLTFYRTLRTSLLFSAAALLVLLAVSVYFNYQPVAHILRKILPREGEGCGPTDEFTLIADTLERAHTAQEQMRAQVAEHRLILIDYIVNSLLSGGEVSAQELSLWEPDARTKRFFVATADGLRLDSQSRKAVSARLQEARDPHVYIADMPHENHTVFLCTLDADQSVQEAQAALRCALCPPCEPRALRMGHPVDAPGKIRESYLRALGADAYEPVAAYLAQDGTPGLLPGAQQAEDLLSFLRCLHSGETPQALASLDNVFSHFDRSDVPAAIQRFVCCDILHQYLHAAKQLDMPPDYTQLTQLASFFNPVELHAALRDVAADLCDAVREKRQNLKDDFTRRIVAYVDAHFTSEETTLMYVGDQFNLSIYALSRIFKEATGVGFKEYITQKRLDKGRELLLSTDMSLKNIAASAGFGSADYFSKLFKARYGLSPSSARSSAGLSVSENMPQTRQPPLSQ